MVFKTILIIILFKILLKKLNPIPALYKTSFRTIKLSRFLSGFQRTNCFVSFTHAHTYQIGI